MSQQEPMSEEKQVETQPVRRAHGPRRPRHEVWRTVGGALLIVLGVTLLIERVSGIDLSWVPLALGIAFLAVWARERWYGFLVAGSILTGIGLSSVARSLLEARWSDGISTIAFGAGFLLIYALDRWRGRSWWGFIVGVIFLVIGTFELAPAVRDFVDPRFGREALPVLVILLGVVLLLRGALSRGAYRVLIVLLLILAIVAAALSSSRVFTTDFDIFGGFRRFETTKRLDISNISDRVLVVDAGSGGVRIITGGDEARAIVSARAGSSRRAREAAESVNLVSEFSGNEAILRTRESVSSGTSIRIDYEIGISEVRRIRVITSSGDVTVETDLETLDVRVASGDVSVNGSFDSVDISSSSGEVEGTLVIGQASDYRIRTSSGDVQLELEADDPRITITTSSGSIEVDAFEGTTSDRSFRRSGAGGSLDIRTSSGDIEIR